MTEAAAPRCVTIHQMKELIGSFFFVWTELERALAGSEQRRKGLLALINDWGTRERDATARETHAILSDDLVRILNEALEIRNRIAHGLVGWRADPSGRTQDAAFFTELNGMRRDISHADLERLVELLASFRWIPDALRSAAGRPEDQAHAIYDAIRHQFDEWTPREPSA